jgi:hypothetical protein
LRLTDDAPLAIPQDGNIRMASWAEWAVHIAREADSFNISLVPYLPFLETALISKINGVVLSQFVVAARMMAGFPFRTGNMGMLFSSNLPDFLIACEDLRVYIERNPSLSS